MTSEQVTIYALCEPESGEIRYVGQTCRTLEHRLMCHLSSRVGRARAEWIAELRARSSRPRIILLEITDTEHADEVEARHIADHRARGCALTNSQRAPRATLLRAKHKPSRQERTIDRLRHGQRIVVELAPNVTDAVVAWAARDRRSVCSAVNFLAAEALAARAAAVPTPEEEEGGVMSEEERRAQWGAGWADATNKLRYLLLRRLEQVRAQQRTEESLGGDHLACYRSAEALLHEIGQEMGVDLERAP